MSWECRKCHEIFNNEYPLEPPYSELCLGCADDYIAELEAHLAEKDAEIERLKDKIEELENESACCNCYVLYLKRIEELEKTLKNLYNGTKEVYENHAHPFKHRHGNTTRTLWPLLEQTKKFLEGEENGKG